MPTALHPQAKFDPIPPDLDLHALVDKTLNFDWVKRISVAQIRNLGQREFEKLVLFHVIQGGKPLVVEKWDKHLPKSLFSTDWLEKTYDKQQENVRDINSQSDIPMTMGHYLRSMKQLTNQWSPTNFRDERRQRLYLKDIDCPPEWHARLRNILPSNLFYLNENVERKPSRRDEEDLDMFPEDRDPAPAGDLMSSLSPEMRAQNLMCYIGHEGTYTPAHKEMCASLGQNIMVDASGDEDGEKPGSSIWFMTETKDREVVREYFLSMLGHDIEIEKHFAQINAWKKATFPVYIVEQKVGDFILVPPLAAHQVWNRGTRTVKVAWNRTTVETLDMALHEALPKARLVCRDEQYKNKSIIYFTLQKYYKQLHDLQDTADMAWLGIGPDLFKDSPRVQQLVKDFRSLFNLFTEILVSEMFATREKAVEHIEFDSNITCSYCRSNIFNRFLTCKHCVRQLINGDEDTYDVCMECYAMGRSCLCISGLSWCEQWRWSDLVSDYEAWRAMVIQNDGFIDLNTSPMPLEIARKKYGKKSVAQICQEQLRRRPWKDITKNDLPSDPEPSEPEVGEDGRPLKKKRKFKKKGNLYRCHVCSKKDYDYRIAHCTTPGCSEGYCYGVLYRAFDALPQAVMENEQWKCPKCLEICNCGHCRRYKRDNLYVPKNTLLGHDTRAIADDRSVDTLVDLRIHNLAWLKNSGDESRNLESKRMQRLRQAAEAEKAKDGDLAESMPALSNADAAAAPVEAGDGEPVVQEPAPPSPSQTHLRDGPSHGHGHGHDPAADADMSLVEDDSMYPDPSTFADAPILGQERMVGLGYYQQDDSPDKILFDPYQEPSAEAVKVDNDVEISEYAKKALRAAKRRARMEEDNDPDFAAPRSHHRKRPRTEKGNEPGLQEDVLNNMDPDLFREDNNANNTSEDAPFEQAQANEPGHDQEDSVHQDPDRTSLSPHRPALRATRPKISYVELDDGGDESDEALPGEGEGGQPPTEETALPFHDPVVVGEGTSQDPLDLASAAIQAIAQAPDEPEAFPAASPPPPTSVKRRGGHPGRPRKSGARPSTRPTRARASTDGPRKASVRGRRGRSSGRFATRETEEPTKVQEAETETRETSPLEPSIDELDAQLARKLAAFDDNGEHSEAHEDDKPVTTPARPAKRPGRPPKKKPVGPREKMLAVEIPRTRPPPPPPASDMQFLSMKERMALKGKKFKIGKRKSDGSSGPKDNTSTPNATATKRVARAPSRRSLPEAEPSVHDAPTHDATPEPPLSPGGSERSYAPSPNPSSRSSPGSPRGPTVVRLGEDEDEDEDEDMDMGASFAGNDIQDNINSRSSASSFSGEDEDIPARRAPTTSFARRGGGSATGTPSRGRGRGRGRGRPGGRAGRARRGRR